MQKFVGYDFWSVSSSCQQSPQECPGLNTLKGKDLPCTYLAHLELESISAAATVNSVKT